MAKKPNNKIVGGMFGLEEFIHSEDNIPTFLDKPHLLMTNARSCIHYVNQLISPRNVWMPSYLCEAMLNAVKNSQVNFYGINYDLKIESLEWIKNIDDGDLVILIDYFSVPIDSEISKEIKKSGAWIIADASHALLNYHRHSHADFIIYSLRKFIGVPDGGILIINKHIEIPESILKPPPAYWQIKALNSTVLRREFDLYGGDRLWFSLFQEVDQQAPIGNYSISEVSELIFKYCCDYSEISEKRKNNYRYLQELIGMFNIHKEYDSNLVPLGFPIKLKNRDEVRQKLFENDIYPPIHWNIADIIPDIFEESHVLSDHIMTLPCDQRYSENEMKRISEIVLKYAK